MHAHICSVLAFSLLRTTHTHTHTHMEDLLRAIVTLDPENKTNHTNTSTIMLTYADV